MAESNRKGKKRPLIQISSSEESSEEDDHRIHDVSSSEDEDCESEWNESDDDECSSDNKDDADDLDDDESEKSDLLDLNLKECKAYLRKNGLRLSGTKLECMRRIEEHQRLEDGNSEALYPRSSFFINCTGDVCKGDVVLFTQKVYKKFDKMTKSGSILGKRTIAGRIVKESYGAAKQQHTFTVEVLWSKGVKKLPTLFPLLVKGRNLYRLKTFRQRWENEEERVRVLNEKHNRGAAARSVRATRKFEAAKRMKNRKASTKKGGSKRQKHSHQHKEHRKENHEKSHSVRHVELNRNKESIVLESQRYPNYSREYSFQSYPYPRNLNHAPLQTHYGHFNPYQMRGEHREYSHDSATFAFGEQSRNFNYFPKWR